MQQNRSNSVPSGHKVRKLQLSLASGNQLKGAMQEHFFGCHAAKSPKHVHCTQWWTLWKWIKAVADIKGARGQSAPRCHLVDKSSENKGQIHDVLIKTSLLLGPQFSCTPLLMKSMCNRQIFPSICRANLFLLQYTPNSAQILEISLDGLEIPKSKGSYRLLLLSIYSCLRKWLINRRYSLLW